MTAPDPRTPVRITHGSPRHGDPGAIGTDPLAIPAPPLTASFRASAPSQRPPPRAIAVTALLSLLLWAAIIGAVGWATSPTPAPPGHQARRHAPFQRAGAAMKPELPLAAELLAQADQLKDLAKLVHTLDPRLAQQLVFHAATLGLRHLRAERIERELATAQHTVRELHHQAAEEADAAEAKARAADPTRAEQWQRRARIISAMLQPPKLGGCHLGGGA